MNRIFYLLFLSLLLIPISDSFADVWNIQIPPGASEISSSNHFIPQEISIKPGDLVEWGNSDRETHTVTSGSLETGIDGKFTSILDEGKKFVRLFTQDELGEFKYFCTIHPWMTGIINVVDLPEDFQVIHNVGSEISDVTFDIPYKVKRNLTDIKIDNTRNMLIFDFVGKIDNDVFVVYLPQELIKNPQSVWVGDNQIMNYNSEPTKSGTTLTIPLEGHTSQVKVVGTDVIGEFSQKPFVLINQIITITDKQTYLPGDIITISGEIKNPSQLDKILSEIISPSGITIYSENILLKDSRFTIDVSTDVLMEFGEYQIDIKGKDINSSPIYFDFESKYPSPKKQMTEIEPVDVTCNEGLELLMKNSNGKAICVTPTTAEILMKRGWADYF
ncbi:plastocyanin/azurin family copper-binding protein [Nitrosopumilus sp. b3]|uniref:cupredoxin domain-containing protein n=1 Tax=Nitrosopumilus sp. b3 TaxID=2109909 RepID=UPI0015F49393|nr:plastocyanin/azurin family copper-binding protein [Nitrosopumilus sp. b3]